MNPRRRARERSRILRSILLLVLLGVVYALVVVWQRDTTHKDNALGTLEPFRRTAQAALDASGRLPLALEKTDPEGRTLPAKRFTYLPANDIRALRAFDGPVMLGLRTRSSPNESRIKRGGLRIINNGCWTAGRGFLESDSCGEQCSRASAG